MDVKFETLVSVWDNQIPKLLIDFVNTAVFTRSENELRTAIAYLSESTDFDKFFAYGYGRIGRRRSMAFASLSPPLPLLKQRILERFIQK